MEEAYSGSYPASKSHSVLHSVRKAQAKPWKKATVAPATATTAMRVYKVDAINFRDLVQQLTGAPETKTAEHHQLFQSVSTPPKTTLSSRDNIAVSSSTNWYLQGAQSETLELNLSSPSSYNWYSVPRINQGTTTTTL